MRREEEAAQRAAAEEAARRRAETAAAEEAAGRAETLAAQAVAAEVFQPADAVRIRQHHELQRRLDGEVAREAHWMSEQRWRGGAGREA